MKVYGSSVVAEPLIGSGFWLADTHLAIHPTQGLADQWYLHL